MNTIFSWIQRSLALLALVGWMGSQAAVAAEVHSDAKPAAASHGAADSHAASAGHDGHGHGAKPMTFLRQFGYSYLTAYMFGLSLMVGCLFLVLVHHLFDAGWSVPIRRVAENVACLAPVMFLLLLPILALQTVIFDWRTIDPATDHALYVKKVLFNPVSWNALLVVVFGIWTWMAFSFRKWSVAQDKDGAAKWTKKARVLAGGGIFVFAFSLTLVCFFLMKSLQHQFFSTMYGVYYFAGSVWTTLATMYALATLWGQPGKPLAGVVHKRQIQDLGVWFFAFTVFYSYIHFSQYFLIWNAALPEETFWYVKREVGSWKWVGFLILFGHFFVPFLFMLNQDVKKSWVLMRVMVVWAWFMHYVDMTFNIMPVAYPSGLHASILDPICFAAVIAVMWIAFKWNFAKAAPYPLRDPRLKEAITHHEVPGPGEAAAHH